MSENVQGTGNSSVSGSLPVYLQGTEEAAVETGQTTTVPPIQDTIASADEEVKGMTIQADSPKPTQPEVIDGAAANITPAMLMQLTPAQLQTFLNSSLSGADSKKLTAAGIGTLILAVMNQYYEIARSVLDAWVKNVQEESQRVKDYINSAEYQKKLMANSAITAAANQRSEAVENKAKSGGNFQGEVVGATALQQSYILTGNAHASAISAFSQGLQPLSNDLALGTQDATDVSLKERTNVAIGTLITAASVTAALSMGSTVEASLIAYVPIRDAVNASMQVVPSQQMDNSAAVAMLAALLGGGMLQSATVDSHVTAQAESKTPSRTDVAQAFVSKVFQHIYSEEFETSVLSLVITDPAKRAEVENNPELKAQTLATVRFAMLAVALDVTFSALNKPLDSTTFLALMNEDPAKLTQETYGGLSTEVQNLVRGLNIQLAHLPEESQEDLKLSLATHFDTRVDDSQYFVPLEDLDTVVRSLPRMVAPMQA